MDSLKRVKIALTHREPDRAPLDIGGTRVSKIHDAAYREFRRGLGLPPGLDQWMSFTQRQEQRCPDLLEGAHQMVGRILAELTAEPFDSKLQAEIEEA
jgi:hypothetical protein